MSRVSRKEVIELYRNIFGIEGDLYIPAALKAKNLNCAQVKELLYQIQAQLTGCSLNPCKVHKDTVVYTVKQDGLRHYYLITGEYVGSSKRNLFFSAPRQHKVDVDLQPPVMFENAEGAFVEFHPAKGMTAASYGLVADGNVWRLPT